MLPPRSADALRLSTSSTRSAARQFVRVAGLPAPKYAAAAAASRRDTFAWPTARRGITMAAAVSVDVKPSSSTYRDHHVGSPPTAFRNPWPSAGAGSHLLSVLKTRFGSDRNLVPIPTDTKQLVQVRKPDWGAGKSGIKATWFGHASFLVETTHSKEADRGIRILFDPVFSERMSPVNFAGPLRFVPLPCTLDEVPDADLVVISHNHYDHLDIDTIKKLYAKRGAGSIHFLCPLGIKSWFLSAGVAAADVTELDWWHEVSVHVNGAGSALLACTPSQHFSGRGLLDHGNTLWCSWALRDARGARLFFAGDTGYRHVTPEALAAGDDARNALPACPVFKDIGEKYGPFDLAMLPIGCYSPRPMLSKIHCSPEDSVWVHRDVRSKKSIGMHYGTIRGGLSKFYEPVTDPPVVWREACEKAGLKWGEEVGLCDIGETVVVPAGSSDAQGEAESNT